MKKIVLSLLFSVGFILAGMAQLGIKPAIGVNFSSPRVTDNDFNHMTGTGFQIGGSVQLGNKFYVEPGIFWTSYANKIVMFEEDEGHPLEYNTIRIPAMLGLNILGNNDKSLLNLSVFVGPSANIFVNMKDDEQGYNKDYMKAVAWSANAGIGVAVWFVFLDVGYEYGFTNTYSYDEDGYKNDIKVSSIWVNLGARLRL